MDCGCSDNSWHKPSLPLVYKSPLRPQDQLYFIARHTASSRMESYTQFMVNSNLQQDNFFWDKSSLNWSNSDLIAENSSLSWGESVASTWNNTNLTWNEEDTMYNNSSQLHTAQLPLWFLSFHLGIRSIEGLLALLTNGLTALTIIKYEELHTTSNYLILNLAFADFISGFVPMLVVPKEILQEGFAYHILCLIEQLLTLQTVFLNLSTILLIGAERYVFIAYPLHYEMMMSERRVKALIASTWVVGTVQTGIFLYMKGVEFKEGAGCTLFATSAGLAISRVEFAAITIGILAFYGNIARIAIKKSKEIYPQQVGDQ